MRHKPCVITAMQRKETSLSVMARTLGMAAEALRGGDALNGLICTVLFQIRAWIPDIDRQGVCSWRRRCLL
jgi:hypothetical protein